MSYKKVFILSLILVISFVFVMGCDLLPQESGSRPDQPVDNNETSEAIIPASPTSAPYPPIELSLSISHAPKVGEVAQVTLTVLAHYAELREFKARLEFQWADRQNVGMEDVPPEEILVDGSLDWVGVLIKGGAPPAFNTDIQFPKEGIWEVTGYIEGDDNFWVRSNHIRLAVEHDRAGIYSGSATTPEWMKDYSPTIAVIVDAPIMATLEMSEPPKLGQPAELTWTVVSDRDMENARVWMEFNLLKSGSDKSQKFETEALLIEGNLQWEGMLQEDNPISSTAIISFLEEGDWQIILLSLAPAPPTSYSGSDEIYLNVTKERGRWGWAESHERDWSDVPPPPTVEEWLEEKASESQP